MDHGKLVIIILSVLALASCSQSPAELTVKCTNNGNPETCYIQAINDDGRQVAEVQTDTTGLGRFNKLKPGQYTLTFMSLVNNRYPNTVMVEVEPGSMQHVTVNVAFDPDKQPRQSCSTSG